MWTTVNTVATGLCALALVILLASVLMTWAQNVCRNTQSAWFADLPIWMRWLWPWAQTVLALVMRIAPPRLHRHAARALVQAGYGERLDVAYWLALHAALAGWLVVFAALAAWSLAMSLPMLLISVVLAGGVGVLWPSLWLYEQIRRRRARIVRDLPFVLDLATLCVEAGLNLPGALQQAVTRGPAGPLRDELALVLAEIRAGSTRMQALRALAERLAVPGLRSVVAALAQADALGMGIAPVLRAQAEALRSKRFLQAERLALQAPVKMLLPLVVCIFPCTFLVIGFPILVRLLAYG